MEVIIAGMANRTREMVINGSVLRRTLWSNIYLHAHSHATSYIIYDKRKLTLGTRGGFVVIATFATRGTLYNHSSNKRAIR